MRQLPRGARAAELLYLGRHGWLLTGIESDIKSALIWRACERVLRCGNVERPMPLYGAQNIFVNTDAIGTNRRGHSCAATSRDASRASPRDARRGDTNALPTRSRRRARRRHRRLAAGARTNYDRRGRTNRRLPAEQIRCRAPGQERREWFSCLAKRAAPVLSSRQA